MINEYEKLNMMVKEDISWFPITLERLLLKSE